MLDPQALEARGLRSTAVAQGEEEGLLVELSPTDSSIRVVDLTGLD